MPYPSYSYLEPELLRSALDMARTLGDAAAMVDRLTFGGAASGRGDGGRQQAVRTVIGEWIGPARDTFDLLVGNERDAAVVAASRLAEDAEAWARFWATATNARNDRLYDEAVQAYELTMLEYERDLVTNATASSVSGIGLRPPGPPVRSPPVYPPTIGANYHPPPDR